MKRALIAFGALVVLIAALGASLLWHQAGRRLPGWINAGGSATGNALEVADDSFPTLPHFTRAAWDSLNRDRAFPRANTLSAPDSAECARVYRILAARVSFKRIIFLVPDSSSAHRNLCDQEPLNRIPDDLRESDLILYRSGSYSGTNRQIPADTNLFLFLAAWPGDTVRLNADLPRVPPRWISLDIFWNLSGTDAN